MQVLKTIECCLMSLALGLGGCAGSSASRATCEGLQARVRVVDPLADPKFARDHPTCREYEAERKRLQDEQPK